MVHGVIEGIPVPFTVDDPNACDGSAKIKCPLKAKQPYIYSTSIFVKSIYPKVGLVSIMLNIPCGSTVQCQVVLALLGNPVM